MQYTSTRAVGAMAAVDWINSEDLLELGDTWAPVATDTPLAIT